jgi:hypothetical protein
MRKIVSKWPLLLIVLDILGAIIAAIGILEFIENGSFNALLLIGAGLCLMLPLTLYILKLLPQSGTNDKPEGED